MYLMSLRGNLGCGKPKSLIRGICISPIVVPEAELKNAKGYRDGNDMYQG